MKRLNIILLTLLITTVSLAQQNSDGRIAIFPVVNNQSGTMPRSAVDLLETKMQGIVTSEGFGSSSRADRFVIVAKPAVISKDVAPTTPPRISQTVEITFVIGDVVENKTYASCTLTLKGIGINETKAWTTALGKIKSNNDGLQKMLSDAYGKIETFYSSNCHTIIAQAETDAAQGNYDKAIASLVAVPDICSGCYAEAQQKTGEIYQRKIDAQAAVLLSKAKSEWSASPNYKGAKKAFAYLIQIDPLSSSFAAKESFETKMASKLSADEQRIWEQEQKKYKDELKLRQKEQKNIHQREMATIAASRSVAEKWAQNQPQTKIYLNW